MTYIDSNLKPSAAPRNVVSSYPKHCTALAAAYNNWTDRPPIPADESDTPK
jgi:hypothetical protein